MTLEAPSVVATSNWYDQPLPSPASAIRVLAVLAALVGVQAEEFLALLLAVGQYQVRTSAAELVWQQTSSWLAAPTSTSEAAPETGCGPAAMAVSGRRTGFNTSAPAPTAAVWMNRRRERRERSDRVVAVFDISPSPRGTFHHCRRRRGHRSELPRDRLRT